MPKIKRKIKKKGKLKTKKILKLKKKNVKLKLKNENNENKSISSNQEEKPEIKKIKKQPSEKRQYNVKDFVGYPKHGVGKITAVEKANIGQIEIQFYKIYIDKE